MTSVETCFGNLFFVSKLLMVFPLRQGKTGFYRSRWLTSLTILHIVFLLFGIFYLFYIKSNLFRQDTMGRSLFISMILIRVVGIIFFVICPMLSVERLNNIQKELKAIDAQLSDYFITLDGPKVWLWNLFYVGIDITAAIFDIYLVQNFLPETIYLYWTIIINHIVEIEVMGLIDVFLVRFNALSRLMKTTPLRKTPSLMRAVKLSKIYRSLTDCFLQLNELLSVQLLCYTCSCFVKLAVESYCLILLACDKFQLVTLVEYFVHIFVVISSFVNFYLIANRAQNASMKAKELKILLYKLIQADPTYVLSNDKSLQLNITWKKEVDFNICGFFNLDLALVQSMVGAVATYFVMILQFSERNANQNA